MSKELAKAYDPSEVEDRIYDFWMKGNYFHAEPDPKKKPYTIVIPPPNITGQLHMGHALDETLQDILIRWRRMQGYCALWLPGTDHGLHCHRGQNRGGHAQRGPDQRGRWPGRLLGAGLGVEAPVTAGRIVEQLKKLGSSCDWERERFYSGRGLFQGRPGGVCHLYEKGLIYRGSRLVNWCPHCNTSISDAEVEYQEKGRKLLAPAVSRQGDRRDLGAGHHPSRDHAG